MSESRAVEVAILDKFRQILVVLYQRRAKKMSENAERPARSGRGSGEKERPTATSMLIPAAERVRRSGRPSRA